MKTIEIKHRITSAVLSSTEVADDDLHPTRTAVVSSIARGANLGGADLRGAYLGGADLRDADLGDANLRGAYLGGADLGGADLGGANLGGADLRGAYLGGADLRDADLGGADLRGAYLGGADLGGADLGDANLGDANLGGADLGGADLGDANLGGAYLAQAKNLPSGVAAVDPSEPYVRPTTTEARKAARARRALRFREQNPDVPVIEQPDVQILARVEADPKCFDQSTWHCGTTHCTAGHMVDLAGPAGYELEKRLGSTQAAARNLYLAAIGTVPHFYGQTGPALDRLRERAAEQLADIK